jgi:hypothetical protein
MNSIAVRGSWPELGRGTAATFHAGTLIMFDTSVRPWLDSLSLAPKLYITGHSMGGMTAQAVALYMHYVKRRGGLELFSFGALFIGNAAAARLMADTRIPAVTVTAQGDSVPTLTMPYVISGYAPWGTPSATATQRSIVIVGTDAAVRIEYRYAMPSYALPTRSSFRLHLLYPTLLANIVAASKAARCTHSLLAYHSDKAGQCAAKAALCVKSGAAAPVPCGSAGYCNLSNNCYYK